MNVYIKDKQAERPIVISFGNSEFALTATEASDLRDNIGIVLDDLLKGLSEGVLYSLKDDIGWKDIYIGDYFYVKKGNIIHVRTGVSFPAGKNVMKHFISTGRLYSEAAVKADNDALEKNPKSSF